MKFLVEKIKQKREEQKARDILIDSLLKESEKGVHPLDRLLLAEHGIYL